MDNLTVELSVAQHCIRTAAHRETMRLVEILLASDASHRELEQKLELLTRFLAEHDFQHLRAAHPELAGGSPRRVAISLDRDGKTTWSWV